MVLSVRRGALLAAIAVALLLSLWAGLQLWRTPTLTLHVLNRSDQPVSSVSLSGSAVETAASAHAIAPGDSVHLQVELAREGEVRVEIAQGLNRIDSELGRGFDRAQERWLTIEDGHRFLFSESSPAP